MAALEPDVQVYVDTQDAFKIGIHKVTLAGTPDTVEVQDMVLDSSGSVVSTAIAELDDGNNSGITSIVATNKNTVTITGGSVNEVVWFITMHTKRLGVNFGAEDSSDLHSPS
jgi:hypothetical protein